MVAAESIHMQQVCVIVMGLDMLCLHLALPSHTQAYVACVVAAESGMTHMLLSGHAGPTKQPQVVFNIILATLKQHSSFLADRPLVYQVSLYRTAYPNYQLWL